MDVFGVSPFGVPPLGGGQCGRGRRPLQGGTPHILLVLALCASVRAADLSTPALTLDETTNTSPPAETQPNATGDWLGIRPALKNKGLTIAGLVELDTAKVLRGGIDTDSTFVRYLFDLNLTLDTDAAFHWPGGTLFLDFQSHDGSNASAEGAGDVQGFDNLEAPHFVQIYQLWYQQKFAGGALRVKAGKINTNSDFSVIDDGSEFLNSAAAYTPTMFPFVTYPDPAPGAEVFFQPGDWFYAGGGAFYSNGEQAVLDLIGHPQAVERTNGGTFLIAEAGSRWNLSLNGQTLAGHAGVGGWYHTGTFPRIDNPRELVRGSSGEYVFGDQTLWSEDSSAAHPARDVAVFFDGGYADPRSSPIDEQLGGGFAATGFVPARPADIVGVFASWAHVPAQADLRDRRELAFEGFYKLQLFRWFSLKPDFQYIVRPSGRYPDAAVVMVRAEVDF